MECTIIEDDLHPVVKLSFPKDARTDSGALVRMLIKDLPGRRFNGSTRTWQVSGFGIKRHPFEVLTDFGAELDDVDLDLLDRYWYPALIEDRGSWLVYPRLAGYEAIDYELDGGTWDREARAFRSEAVDLIDAEGKGSLSGVELPQRLIDQADTARVIPDHFDIDLAAQLSDEVEPAPGALEEAQHHAPFPENFGGEDIDLYDFQTASAYAAHYGRSLLALPMGSGKTPTSLAAAALAKAQRLLVVAPPVAITNWGKEARRAMEPIFASYGTDDEAPSGKAGEHGPHIRAVHAGRKVPDFPEVGTVILPDSLLQREDLRDAIEQWQPDFLLVDEAHRFRTWDALRSVSIRSLASTLPIGRRVAITGTPMLNHPGEMANLLAITGQLYTEFGSRASFFAKYTLTDKWGKVKARKKALPKLGKIMDARCWVMHTKEEVLPHLPEKHRVFLEVDVDLAGYREAHSDVIDSIIERFGGDEAMAASSRKDLDNIIDEAGVELLSPMRKASGMAKIATAAEMIEEMRAVDDSPIIVFAHHKPVVKALAETAPGRTAIIDGGTSAEKRGAIQADFQDGKVDVVVASIAAAGVAITLTAAHRLLFVENDWTPALNAQAEDRAHRIGQQQSVEVTNLIAAGTLDEHLHQVLANKIDDLVDLTGTESHGEAASAEAKINELLEQVVNSAFVTAKRRVKKSMKG